MSATVIHWPGMRPGADAELAAIVATMEADDLLPVATACLGRVGTVAAPSARRALVETAVHALVRFLDHLDTPREDLEPEGA